MRTNGFYGIGCLNMKREFNYGTLFRTAQVFDADFVFVIGNRFKPQHSDTDKSWKNLPTYHYLNFKDFNDHRPFACVLVGIELTEDATPIAEFAHPRQACYLLGAEDSGLSPEAIERCQSLIKLPGSRSLNVSVAGSLVLFDRFQKTTC